VEYWARTNFPQPPKWATDLREYSEEGAGVRSNSKKERANVKTEEIGVPPKRNKARGIKWP